MSFGGSTSFKRMLKLAFRVPLPNAPWQMSELSIINCPDDFIVVEITSKIDMSPFSAERCFRYSNACTYIHEEHALHMCSGLLELSFAF